MKTCLILTTALLAGACSTPPPPAAVVPAATVSTAAPMTAAGPDFLARNALAKGVVTTASGLQYYVLKSGPATGAHPAATDVVSFDYEGKLTDGTKFDSSFDRGEPLVGPANGFVPGFTEALTLMRPGDEWVVWIPPALGYGAEDKGPIPGNSVLRFRLALHSVTPAAVQ